MLNLTEHEISTARKKSKLLKKTFLAFKLSDDVFNIQINLYMPTIAGILTFMNMTIIFQLS